MFYIAFIEREEKGNKLESEALQKMWHAQYVQLHRVAKGPQPQFGRESQIERFSKEAARRVKPRACPEPCRRDGRNQIELPLRLAKKLC